MVSSTPALPFFLFPFFFNLPDPQHLLSPVGIIHSREAHTETIECRGETTDLILTRTFSKLDSLEAFISVEIMFNISSSFKPLI